MRGKPLLIYFPEPLARITPADAGKTTQGFPYFIVHKDHPRGCGENIIFSIRIIKPPGSPPRMRGKPVGYCASVASDGITPADAGKTNTVFCFKPRCRDHPRGCGENRLFCGRFALKLGSPPRMRGKLNSIGVRRNIIRITPADAGKTKQYRSSPQHY